MKQTKVYVTCDYVQHTSKDKAISHLLNSAHMELCEVLKQANVDGAYRISQIIINNAYENGLTSVYDRLKNVTLYLADTELIDYD